MDTVAKRIAAVLAVSLSAGCSDPINTAEDCVLKELSASMSEQAGHAIYDSCHAKYPTVTELLRQNATVLDDDARAKITGRLGIGDFGTASGNLYNGNDDWRILKVVVAFYPPDIERRNKLHDDDPDTFSKPTVELYEVSVDISPQSSTSTSFAVNWRPSIDHSWSVYQALGVKREGHK